MSSHFCLHESSLLLSWLNLVSTHCLGVESPIVSLAYWPFPQVTGVNKVLSKRGKRTTRSNQLFSSIQMCNMSYFWKLLLSSSCYPPFVPVISSHSFPSLNLLTQWPLSLAAILQHNPINSATMTQRVACAPCGPCLGGLTANPTDYFIDLTWPLAFNKSVYEFSPSRVCSYINEHDQTDSTAQHFKRTCLA